MAYANILAQIIQIACLQNIANRKEKYVRLSVAQAKAVRKDLLALLQKGHVINLVRNKRIARETARMDETPQGSTYPGTVEFSKTGWTSPANEPMKRIYEM